MITIIKVSDTLYRSARPDLTDTNTISQLKQFGINQILSLEEGWFEWFHCNIKKEDELALLLGLGFIHIPLPDLSGLDSEELEGILNTYQMGEKAGLKTLVHCLHGQDRTGIACALYRVKIQGWSLDSAIKEMYEMGFHQFPYKWLGWVNALKKYCNG